MEASRALPLSHASAPAGESVPISVPGPSQAVSSITDLRLRRAFGIALGVGVMLLQFARVVVAWMLLQFAADVVAARETARILARMAFMSFELPLLMVALSSAFGWSLPHRMTARKGLLA